MRNLLSRSSQRSTFNVTCWNSGSFGKPPRLVGSGRNDSVLFAAHSNGLAAQFWISGLLDGRKKGVCVEMND
jgi:hypothetical protein